MASSEVEEQQQQQPQPQEQSTDEPAPESVFYKTKTIDYFGRSTPIILQNNNGPCLLIALCNVLLLKNKLNLTADVSEVSQEKLLSLVAERLLDSDSSNNNKDAGYVENQQQNISDVIKLLPRLTTGIDVNIKFNRIDAFEFTESAICNLLGIPLCHGWLVDPQDHETAQAIGSKFYNTLMCDLVSLETWKMANMSKDKSDEDRIDFAVATTAADVLKSFNENVHKSPINSSYEGHSTSGPLDVEPSVSGSVVHGQYDGNLPLSEEKALFLSLTEDREKDHDQLFPAQLGEVSLSNDLAECRLDTSFLSEPTPLNQEAESWSTPVIDTEGSHKLSLEQTSSQIACHADGSEPIYEGEECILDPGKTLCEDQEPVYEGEVVLAEQADKGVKDACDVGHGISLRQGELIDNFLKSNASQLTSYGLLCLQTGLDDHELRVFFRNNHFSTILKLDGELYVLTTDQGYMNQPDLVWEKLNEATMHGDTVFMTSDFKESRLESSSNDFADLCAAISRLSPARSIKPIDYPFPKKLMRTTPITFGDVELPQLGRWGSLEHSLRLILLACPPRVLLEWRRVNKNWKSFLTNDTFIRNHMEVWDEKLTVFAINEDTVVALTFPKLEYYAALVVPVPLKKKCGSLGGYMKTTSTVDGLVLLEYVPIRDSPSDMGLMIWNPTLNRFRAIHMLNISEVERVKPYDVAEVCDIVMMFDDISRNYYLVARVFFKIKEGNETVCLSIYLLKLNASHEFWIESSCSKVYHGCTYRAVEGVVLKKKLLCWLVTLDSTPMIEVFDLSLQKMQCSIMLPDINLNLLYSGLHLRTCLYCFGDKLRLCFHHNIFEREDEDWGALFCSEDLQVLQRFDSPPLGPVNGSKYFLFAKWFFAWYDTEKRTVKRVKFPENPNRVRGKRNMKTTSLEPSKKAYMICQQTLIPPRLT